ncbi:MAG: 1,2-phenylacetyl-CoA epoxidase subunit PaaD [Anaerolineae bacterium]
MAVTEKMAVTEAQVWSALEDVKDPEIPMVSVVELGIIQAVELDGDSVRVTITPTFSGCPAMDVMREGIVERVRALGADRVEVNISLTPRWTSDRIAASARERMKTIGLAPPTKHGGELDLELLPLVRCPYCGSSDTVMENPFGPTLCRALHYCNSCQQPFEQFKAL